MVERQNSRNKLPVFNYDQEVTSRDTSSILHSELTESLQKMIILLWGLFSLLACAIGFGGGGEQERKERSGKESYSFILDFHLPFSIFSC